MPTILRCYSQRQTNPLLCRTIEYVCKQFYILHRKPFLLQMAGSVANILDTTDSNFEVNPTKVFHLSPLFLSFFPFLRICLFKGKSEILVQLTAQYGGYE